MNIVITEVDEFMRPYVKAAVSGVDGGADTAVMLSSCEIYDAAGAVDTSSAWYGKEQEFIRQNAGRPHVILRAAPIVGTGMHGFVRSLAEDIWRGTFFHFPGNESRLSVVHAVDVAAALVALSALHFASPATTIYDMTDGVNPTLHDLAEALAFRMDNKRISNLSTGPQQWFGRMAYGKKKYASYTTDRIFDGSRLREAINVPPVDVCQYLRTHTYDECSL